MRSRREDTAVEDAGEAEAVLPASLAVDVPSILGFERTETGAAGLYQTKTTLYGRPRDILAFALAIQAEALIELVKRG